MKNELRVFLSAVLYFTRIPCPNWVGHSTDRVSDRLRYFSMIGVIVGITGGIVYCGCLMVFPHSAAVMLSMCSTIWMTRALHEDGLADMLDGFGGGWSRKQILDIMKDSRIGTFGVVGLLGVLSLKFISLYHIQPELVPYVLVAGHALSRFFASTLAFTHDYARKEDPPSASSHALARIPVLSISMNAGFGVMPLILFQSVSAVLALIPLMFIRWYLGSFYQKWIGGWTGDCVGATQQITEAVFYLSFLALG